MIRWRLCTGSAKTLERALGQHECFRLVGAFQQDDELVTAESSHGVAVAHACAQPFGNGAQQFVTGGVTEAVVERLEVVDVDKHQRQASLLRRACECRASAGCGRTAGARFGRPVNVSCNDWCRNSAVSCACSVTSCAVITQPFTFGGVDLIRQSQLHDPAGCSLALRANGTLPRCRFTGAE